MFQAPLGVLCTRIDTIIGTLSWSLISLLLTVELGSHGVELTLGQVVFNAFQFITLMFYTGPFPNINTRMMNLLTQEDHTSLYNYCVIIYIFLSVLSFIKLNIFLGLCSCIFVNSISSVFRLSETFQNFCFSDFSLFSTV